MSLRHLFSPLLRRFCTSSANGGGSNSNNTSGSPSAAASFANIEGEKEEEEEEETASSPNKARKLHHPPKPCSTNKEEDEETALERIERVDRLSPLRDAASSSPPNPPSPLTVAHFHSPSPSPLAAAAATANNPAVVITSAESRRAEFRKIDRAHSVPSRPVSRSDSQRRALLVSRTQMRSREQRMQMQQGQQVQQQEQQQVTTCGGSAPVSGRGSRESSASGGRSCSPASVSGAAEVRAHRRPGSVPSSGAAAVGFARSSSNPESLSADEARRRMLTWRKATTLRKSSSQKQK